VSVIDADSTTPLFSTISSTTGAVRNTAGTNFSALVSSIERVSWSRTDVLGPKNETYSTPARHEATNSKVKQNKNKKRLNINCAPALPEHLIIDTGDFRINKKV
jgi:hypothetical protein